MEKTQSSQSIDTPERERDQKPARYRALPWVLTFPFVFLAVRGYFSFQFANSSPVPGRSVSFLTSAVFPGVTYSIIGWCILTQIRRITTLALRSKWIVVLALFTVASTLWSQNPPKTLYNGIAYLLDTLFAFYLVVAFEPEDLMSILVLGGSVISGLGIFFILFSPTTGLSHLPRTMGAWQGLFIDRTTSAKVIVFMITPAIAFGRKGWSNRRLMYFATMLPFIFLAQAVTAELVFAGYLVMVVLIRLSRAFGKRTVAIVCLTGLPVAVVLGYLGSHYSSAFIMFMGRDPTLTGRTDIWNGLILSVAKRPLLGYGFYAFWEGIFGESANVIIASRWYFGYAHNGYLEILLQLGFVGLGLFFITLAMALKNIWICFRNEVTIAVEWYASIILLTILYNISEATVVWPNDILSILYIVACCGLARTAKQIKQAKGATVRTVAGDRSRLMPESADAGIPQMAR